MAFETLNGIVLRYVDYRDNDRILTVLEREKGLVTVTARGVRSKSSTASGLVRDAYCYGEFVVYDRNGIKYVSSSSIIEAFYPMREDYSRLVAAAQAAYIAEKLASNHAGDELFSRLYHAFSFIAYGNADPADILLCYTAKCLCLAGYEPTLTSCVACRKHVTDQRSIAFSNLQGGSLCDDCDSGETHYPAIVLEALRRMIRLAPAQMDRVRLPEDVRGALDKLLFDYAEFVLEQPIRLKNSKHLN